MDGRTVLASHKAPTSENVSDGIVAAIGEVLRRADASAADVRTVMIGTTHFTNAFVQRQHLLPVGIVRIALPSSRGIPPLSDWPADIAEAMGPHHHMITGGYQFDGSVADPLDEAAVATAFMSRLFLWSPATAATAPLSLSAALAPDSALGRRTFCSSL